MPNPSNTLTISIEPNTKQTNTIVRLSCSGSHFTKMLLQIKLRHFSETY